MFTKSYHKTEKTKATNRNVTLETHIKNKELVSRTYKELF